MYFDLCARIPDWEGVCVSTGKKADTFLSHSHVTTPSQVYAGSSRPFD